MPIEIRKTTVSEIQGEETFSKLLDEYAAESAIFGLPHPSAKIEMYLALEKAGTFAVFGAYLENTLVGLITVLYSILPHYGISVAVSESFFVMKTYRKTGAGLRLKHEAERYTESLGSPGLLMSAPYGSDLAEILEHSSEYVETNRVFFRKF